ncbi:golgin-45 isoform X1 [Atheta coriaria]|uniref:golgin-45 isoform X1 n=1 Tax=Dalotia coriaria TaxID=877792 RepID=UPI0031F47031
METKTNEMKMDIAMRTLGDGMDNSLMTLSKLISSNLHISSLNVNQKSLKPIIPEGPIIMTVPKFIPKERKNPKYLTMNKKEPKFIPCEPFKGAVDPIIPRKKMVKIQCLPHTKNNIDIQDLVHQMSDIRTSELNKTNLLRKDEGKEYFVSIKQWEDEKFAYESDIKNLKETNAHLENQLKFQAKVNSELKTLLVAAVGEDLESRVQHLTEDKLQLARALLNSANHLTSHQEQTEWLSGQCEVWRSKFLASSLMVEELARWKSALTNRISELQENMKVLIDERTKVRNYSLQTYNLLHQINAQQFETKPATIRTANIIDLSMNNLKLAQDLSQVLIKDVKENDDLLKLSTNTPGENMAVKILKNPVKLFSKPDEVCNALVGAAMSITSGQMYLQHPATQATCCKHCKGEIHNI